MIPAPHCRDQIAAENAWHKGVMHHFAGLWCGECTSSEQWALRNTRLPDTRSAQPGVRCKSSKKQ
jgi:hypothetical protein